MKRFYEALLLALALYCVAVLAPSATEAQTSEAMRQMERRVDSMEGQKLGERLARLEALAEAAAQQAETTNKLLIGVFGTLALMLGERILRGGGTRLKQRQLRMFDSGEE
jgi:hypothetical protein